MTEVMNFDGAYHGCSPSRRAMTQPSGEELTTAELADRVRQLEEEVARLEATLRNRAAEFETLVDMIPVGIGVALDHECKSIRVNRAFAEILGIQTTANASKTADGDERPTNFSYYDVHGNLVADRELPMQVSAREGVEIRDLELDLVREDGRVVRMLKYTAPLIDEHGRPRGCVGAFIDISERRQAEGRERRQLNEIAHVSRLSTLGEMVSGLAHEINQPIAAASNFARAALRAVQTDPASPASTVGELLQKILGQTERAGEIVQRLSSFVKKGNSPPTLVDVNELVSNVIMLTKSCFYPATEKQKEIALRTNLSTKLPRIAVDRIQIEQVLVNLIRNAIEASQEAGATDPVLVCTDPDGQFVRVSVSDRGVGVAEETVAKMFEPFFTTKPQGMGLGLSISRSIIENHGGCLWAEPNGSQGATFSFRLPIETHQPWR